MVRKITRWLTAPLKPALLSFGFGVAAIMGAGVSTAVLSGAATAQTAFAPAAIVNEDVITYYDVLQRARILELGGATAGPALNRAALDQLIDNRLQMQVAERANVGASEDEIAAGLRELGARQGLDGAGLVASLNAQGVDEAAIRDVVVSQLVWNRIVNARFNARATPSEGELDTEIEIAASAKEQSFRIAEIAVPANQDNFQQAEAFLEKLRNDIAAGQSFGALAQKNSRSPTANAGGVIGWVPQSSLPPAMGVELSSMTVGAISRPLPVPGGVAIFQLLDRETTSPAWTSTTTYSLQRISAPVGNGAAERASEIAAATPKCGELPELDDDISTARLNDVVAQTLPADVQSAIGSLEVGGKTGPLIGTDTVDVYLVCGKRSGVPAEVREQIRAQIRDQRLTRLAEGFLQEQRRDAVIERR